MALLERGQEEGEKKEGTIEGRKKRLLPGGTTIN
jgi:hypothetical protein